jgi:hypothetical protein
MEIAMIHVRHLICFKRSIGSGFAEAWLGELAHELLLTFKKATPSGKRWFLANPGKQLGCGSAPMASAL